MYEREIIFTFPFPKKFWHYFPALVKDIELLVLWRNMEVFKKAISYYAKL